MNKLSHSAATVYLECEYKYFLHYKDKLRSETTGSALLFGSAVDKAFELALQQFPNCDKKQIQDKFMLHWMDAELNGKPLDLTYTNLVKYSKADYELDEDPWKSLSLKGLLMIEAFFADVLPNIKKVISSQEEISLENENGDKVTGFCDAVVMWKDYPMPIIMDFKTSGRPYKADSVKTSPQLSLYKHALSEKHNTTTAGYIVFIKTINKNALKVCNDCGHDGSTTRHTKCNNEVKGKRCNGELTVTYRPKVDVQVIVDEIDEAFENNVLESFDLVNKKLQQSSFEQNFDACYGKYGKCQYYEYCRTGDTTGLITVPSRSETPKK